MGKTFEELGIPFPLFDAPADQSVEYVGQGECSLCGSRSHCFELGIGCGVMVNCPACGVENGLDADDRRDQECHSCKVNIPFPSLDEDNPVTACYECLRAGRAAITKDTEYGMVSWEQANAGTTHGVPGLRTSIFPLIHREDAWVAAVVPSPILFELLRTPTPSTIQGETWRFCCQSAMTFIGSWDRSELNQRAPDGDGSAYLDKLLGKHVPGLFEDDLHDLTGIYVFRCRKCGRECADWDLA